MVSFHGVRMYPMKKILQSIGLLLLLLTASSKLFGKDYIRVVGGSWGDPAHWFTEGGHKVPNDKRAHVKLYNTETTPLNLDLNTYRTVNHLDVHGNAWTLFGGTLYFDNALFPNPTDDPKISYSGTQTLTLATSLYISSQTLLDVVDPAGTVRLQGEVKSVWYAPWLALYKTGYGTLLIEAPFHVNLHLMGGTTGIAPSSLTPLDGYQDLIVGVESNLFALNGDINISRKLTFMSGAILNIIDNPNDSAPHSITFRGKKTSGGIINQRSHGDLIFAGTDHFEGTINTQTGYGRLVLNGDTAANIQMNGGEITGTGKTRGDLSARNGAIISPGYNGSVGTLSFGNTYLDPSTILNFKLGSTSDLIEVNGNLLLAGNLNISAGSGFKSGESYQLFNYSGNFYLGALDILSVPEGYDASKFFVQTGVIAGQVNLLVPDPEPIPPMPGPVVPDPTPIPPESYPTPRPDPGTEPFPTPPGPLV